ncbi:MAG: citramalate synthase [Treponema sp.]|jgi:2-isopropylmalate synthase|nr:citramalate synthase [Treponema sp.]
MNSETKGAPGVELEILDTTLRDGAQGEGINFSLQDKLAVLRALDELGIGWIEAGSPGSNPKDIELFQAIREVKLEHARLCAFGSTRKPFVRAPDDPRLQSLLEAGTEAVTIFGKSWDLHVREVLRVDREENLAMISETIEYLVSRGKTVFFDAEHFFDGWKADRSYALATLRAALEAGASRIVCCDTNGGSFPAEISSAVAGAVETLGGACVTGIHAHNDMGLALANTLAALEAGCRHVQGTMAGFGERCGNTALAALIPSLELKLNYSCLPGGKLERISEITRRIAEIANVPVPAAMPYVGSSAFSHKGGMHSDGVLKVSRSFEHIDPSSVGNNRHLLLSEVGGRSAIAERVRKLDPSITRDHPAVSALAEKLKALEAEGWAFEGADAGFELLVRRELPGAGDVKLNRYRPLFKILAYRVMSEHPTGVSLACSHAWVKVWVDGQDEIAAAEGDGPVNALDGALRRALIRFYPELEQVRLTDYKVRVIDGGAATAAKVRVLIESTDGPRSWTTVGVSGDIIDASRSALVDSIEYKLIGDIERKIKTPSTEDCHG